jgi:hypothetical protein
LHTRLTLAKRLDFRYSYYAHSCLTFDEMVMLWWF